MIGCLIFIAGGVIQTACFKSLDQFYVGRLLAGIGVGIMSSACPTYASEIAPKEIRGRITGLFQIVVVVGVAFSFWISYGVSYMDPAKGPMQWRVPIGFQLVPVGIMMMLLPFLKESPRWLAVKHRDEKALANLAWIRKTSIDDPDTKLEFAEIQAAIVEEEQAKDGRSFIHEIMRKGNPKRFIIAFVMFTLQQWSGQNSISYYAPIIFESIVSNHLSICTQHDADFPGYHRHAHLAPHQWYLRYRQDCRHGHLHFPRCRALRPEEAPSCRYRPHVHVLVDHRCRPQHPPSS